MKTFKEYLTEGIDSRDIKYFENTMKAISDAHSKSYEEMLELLREIVEESDYDVEVVKNAVYKALEVYDMSFAKVKKALERLLKRAQ